MAKNNLWRYHWHVGNLQWPSLQECRENSSLFLLLFKLTNNTLLVPRAYISCSYLPLPSPLTITGAKHNLKYMHMQTTSRIYQYSFLRTIPQWNNLHIPDLDNLTLNQFKSKLLIQLINKAISNILAWYPTKGFANW